MRNIIQVYPCTFEEAVKAQVWRDAMVEEYESIIHNVMYGKWFQDPKVNLLYLLNGCIKLDMVLMAILKNIKLDLWLEVSLRKRE